MKTSEELQKTSTAWVETHAYVECPSCQHAMDCGEGMPDSDTEFVCEEYETPFVYAEWKHWNERNEDL